MAFQSEKIITASRYSSNEHYADVSGTVLCYGHFNVIHPGHIRFLQYAKTLGSHLSVALVGDHLIADGNKGQYYDQMERADGVASLQMVDGVIILDDVGLLEVVAQINPKILVLGKEFEENRRRDVQEAILAVEAQGGKVVFDAGEIHYAGSELFHASHQEVESGRRQAFLQTCKRQKLAPTTLIERIESFANSRLLVVGDSIVDQYVACDAVGMSAEAPVLVVKELESKKFVGGAGIVAAHINSLGAKSTYLSVIGCDENADFLGQDLQDRGVNVRLVRDENRPTTFKIRYMVENQKLFRVSRLNEHSISKAVEDNLIQELWKAAPDVDGILVADFVYGVVTQRVLQEIMAVAEKYNLKLFGDLQCSSQVGNVSKFSGFDLITPTEKEARLALNNRQDGVEWIANKLLEESKAKSMVLTLGPKGFIAYQNDLENNFISREHFPALASNPVDVAGAGDSLLAALAVGLCSGASLMEASAIGTCMAALAVQRVGNVPVNHQDLKSFIKNLGEL